jgi:hypothetical protein
MLAAGRHLADGAGFHVIAPVQIQDNAVSPGFFKHLPGGFAGGAVLCAHKTGLCFLISHGDLLKNYLYKKAAFGEQTVFPGRIPKAKTLLCQKRLLKKMDNF